MKLLRIWLLVLMAVLLPVRGAMAAAMVCAPAGGSPVQAVAEQHADHGHSGHGQAQAGHDGHAGHASHADRTGPAADQAHASALDKCKMCSASCSTPPVPSAVAGLSAPLESTSAPFPERGAPSPTFQSGGQDRPPRTI